MKRKILRITGENLLNMFVAGLKPVHEVIAGVPPDARIVNVRHGWPNEIYILLESDNFPMVAEGQELPFIDITVKIFAPELINLGVK